MLIDVQKEKKKKGPINSRQRSRVGNMSESESNVMKEAAHRLAESEMVALAIADLRSPGNGASPHRQAEPDSSGEFTAQELCDNLRDYECHGRDLW